MAEVMDAGRKATLSIKAVAAEVSRRQLEREQRVVIQLAVPSRAN
jgi:hypothetical protein